MSTSSAPVPPSAPQSFLQQCAHLRQVLVRGRAMFPADAEFKPNFDLHELRLDEIERLFRTGNPDNAVRIQQLNSDFLTDFNADIAATLGETQEGMARFKEQVTQKLAEKENELAAGLD